MDAIGWVRGVARHPTRRWLTLLYPPHCAACGRPLEDGYVCGACWEGIRPLGAPTCPRCGGPTGAGLCSSCRRGPGAVDRGACYGLYREGTPLASLIQSLKYRGDRALVPLLGALLDRAARALTRPEAITFVPLTRRRRRARGFNQAELLARWLGQRRGLPVRGLVRKVRETAPQAALPRERRLTNLEGAFAARAPGVARVWLVDDVRTTGATLEGCAQALKASGVRRVEALVLAAADPGRAQ